MKKAQVLIIEKDFAIREALCEALARREILVDSAVDYVEGKQYLDKQVYTVVMCDIQAGQTDIANRINEIKARHSSTQVVVTSAYGSVEQAVLAMREGATDYLVKPFSEIEFVQLVARLLPSGPAVEQGMVCVDETTQQVIHLARRVASSDATVMISGESGTGKEVMARFIHQNSTRADGPFIAINCAAIPENMLEAVLFGYEKGAFTGAHQAHPGKFEQANNGTILLDEISEMDLALQAKLLRVLQEREVERIGGRKIIPLNVRVLATTNRELREEVSEKRFREDLYYRLNVFPLKLRPLRERPDDIMPLARVLFLRHNEGREVELSTAAEGKLTAHAWPGNVRELENLVQRALILSMGSMIRAEHIVFEQGTEPSVETPETAQEPSFEDAILADNLKDREQRLILQALQGNYTRAEVAQRLGISQRTLRYKLAKMRQNGIEIPGRQHFATTL